MADLEFDKGSQSPAITAAQIAAAGLVTLTGTQTLSNKQYSLNGALSANNTYEGTQIIGLLAGELVSQWEPVILNSSSKWIGADGTSSTGMPAWGLAVAQYALNAPATVLVLGVVKTSNWSWTPKGLIYIDASAGILTQTPPSASGNVVQIVGKAISATVAFFDFNSTFVQIT